MIELLLVLGLVALVVWVWVLKRKLAFKECDLKRLDKSCCTWMHNYDELYRQFLQQGQVIKDREEYIKVLLACLGIERAFEGERR